MVSSPGITMGERFLPKNEQIHSWKVGLQKLQHTVLACRHQEDWLTYLLGQCRGIGFLTVREQGECEVSFPDRADILSPAKQSLKEAA